MKMQLDKRSLEDLERCRPGVGVIFMKVAENDVRMIEFAPTINNTLSALLIATTPRDLHDWIDYIYYNLIPRMSEVTK